MIGGTDKILLPKNLHPKVKKNTDFLAFIEPGSFLTRQIVRYFSNGIAFVIGFKHLIFQHKIK